MTGDPRRQSEKPRTGLLDLSPTLLAHLIDVVSGTVSGTVASHRRLSELAGCFVDGAAYQTAVEEDDPVVYTLATWAQDDRPGALSFGLGTIQPGRIGQEFYLTKGHYHQWKDAAEVYLGISGAGGLVLENEDGTARYLPLEAGGIVYVPGNVAHRTVNTGDEPFTYLGIYPSKAGHDYSGIADSNFQLVVIAGADGPTAIPRTSYSPPNAHPDKEERS
ncbi:MAG: glucose-6-phosphate isomerase family protein [Propionicimonas sp.]|nr:glucose-6-phosphate isomerase family protein [Propionicimonas sp.]